MQEIKTLVENLPNPRKPLKKAKRRDQGSQRKYVSNLLVGNENESPPQKDIVPSSHKWKQEHQRILLQIDSTTSEERPNKTCHTDVCIRVNSFDFKPEIIRVKRGTRIIWIHDGETKGDIHSVTSVVGLFESPELQKHETFTWDFHRTGVFNYYCNTYSFMTGIVQVVDELTPDEEKALENYYPKALRETEDDAVEGPARICMEKCPQAKENGPYQLSQQLGVWSAGKDESVASPEEDCNLKYRQQLKDESEHYKTLSPTAECIKIEGNNQWEEAEQSNGPVFPTPLGSIEDISVHEVIIKNFKFHPERLTIRRNDVVVWKVTDGPKYPWEHSLEAGYMKHAADSDESGVTYTGRSPLLIQGGQHAWRFNTCGTVEYTCTVYNTTGWISIIDEGVEQESKVMTEEELFKQRRAKIAIKKRKKIRSQKSRKMAQALIDEVLECVTGPATEEFPKLQVVAQKTEQKDIIFHDWIMNKLSQPPKPAIAPIRPRVIAIKSHRRGGIDAFNCDYALQYMKAKFPESKRQRYKPKKKTPAQGKFTVRSLLDAILAKAVN